MTCRSNFAPFRIAHGTMFQSFGVCSALLTSPEQSGTVASKSWRSGCRRLLTWEGRTDHPWLLRILEDESLRALQRMDTPYIPLSIFVANSYKFPLHQLIQLAGLNTWKSGKASTSQCGWLIRDQFSRTFFDSLISVYLACQRVGDWTAIPIKTWKKTDICLFRIFFCSFHFALFWVEVFAHLAQELSVNIALLLNDVPQGRRERQSWHKEHVSVNGERGPSDVAYWCLFGYVWFCLKAYRIEVYFMGLTPAPAGCRRTMWIECFWDTMRELASEAAGTVSVADHCGKACPMLSMIFPQPPRASPIPNFRIRGKNWMCTESSAQWNLNRVCPSGRSKAANQLQL